MQAGASHFSRPKGKGGAHCALRRAMAFLQKYQRLTPQHGHSNCEIRIEGQFCTEMLYAGGVGGKGRLNPNFCEWGCPPGKSRFEWAASAGKKLPGAGRRVGFRNITG